MMEQGGSLMKDKEELRQKLKEAQQLREQWRVWSQDPDCKADMQSFAEAVRNYNALSGVIKTLQWSLDFPGINDCLE